MSIPVQELHDRQSELSELVFKSRDELLKFVVQFLVLVPDLFNVFLILNILEFKRVGISSLSTTCMPQAKGMKCETSNYDMLVPTLISTHCRRIRNIGRKSIVHSFNGRYFVATRLKEVLSATEKVVQPPGQHAHTQ